MRPAISVVLPAYRTSRFVHPIVARLSRALQGRAYEALFVDDACPEDSWSRIVEAARHDPRVGGIALARNVGQHAAVLTAVRHARGEVVVIMDADLQDPPEAIPMLVDRLGTGANTTTAAAAVFGGRRGRYESRGRLLSSRAFKALLSVACRVPPDAGMFVALSRRAVDELCAMRPGPSVVAMIGRACASESLPIHRAVRAEGRSAYSSGMRLRAGLRALAWSLSGGRLAAVDAADPPVRARCGTILTWEIGA